MLFGVNSEIETHAMPGMTAISRNYPQNAGVPESGPPSTGLTSFLTIRPDLRKLADAELDRELARWLLAVPPGTHVALWPGANQPHQEIEAALWKHATQRVQSVKATVNASVQVGYVLDTYPLNSGWQDMDDWIIGHADWAGLIGHQEIAADTPRSVFHDALTQIAESPGMPELVIYETGTAADADAWADQVLGYALRWTSDAPLDALLWYARVGHGKYGGIPGDGMFERMCREAAWAR